MIHTDAYDKVNILNNHFQSQTILDDTNAVLHNLPQPPLDSQLSQLILTPQEVKFVLQFFSLGKASRPNGLSNRILRELAHEIYVPYCSFFNQSLQSGIAPASYKESNVCPISKNGDPSIVSNYRPISPLNSEKKLFERIIFKHLFNHFQDNHLLSAFQSGFIPGDSCINQLTFLYNTFYKAIDAVNEVRAVFCDIGKAFVRVWHAGIIQEFRAPGGTGEVLTWLKSYLSNRRQRVVL